MIDAAASIVIAGAALLVIAGIALLGLAAWWWGRAVTAVASARINLAEMRERENPQPDSGEEARPSIVTALGPPSGDDIMRAYLAQRAERGEVTTDDIAGVPSDHGMGGGAYARANDE